VTTATITITDRSFTIPALARRWRTRHGTIVGMIDKGQIAAFRVGRRWRVSADVVREYEHRTSKPVSQPTRQRRGNPQRDCIAFF
jgi:excisionase family DNA binding protein